MTTVGHVESVWRYPVKSMRGEHLDEAYIGFAGVFGDRLYAFANSGAMKGFPFHTARQQERMLLYTPRFRDPQAAARPVNVAEAHGIVFGANPISAPPEALEIEVETPEGRRLAVTDPALLAEMASTIEGEIRLIRSDRGLMDSRPVSMFSLQTVAQLAEETGSAVDKRQFRANLYLDLDGAGGFAENDFIGKRLQVGERVVLSVVELDPRCKIITLNPDTTERNRELLHHVIGQHDSKAGLYAAVLVDGMVRPGDTIRRLD
jgi:uncharacterized protein YcbX